MVHWQSRQCCLDCLYPATFFHKIPQRILRIKNNMPLCLLNSQAAVLAHIDPLLIEQDALIKWIDRKKKYIHISLRIIQIRNVVQMS